MVPLTDEQHYENRETLKNITSEAPNEVARVIRLYNYDNDGPAIYKEMMKSSKKDLQAAAEYLLLIPTDEVKTKLVTSIIQRIDSLLLEHCEKCELFYNVHRLDNPSVSCQNCGQGAHEPCYKDLSVIIATHPGIIYLCSRCENSSSKRTALSPTQSEELSQPPPRGTQSPIAPRPLPHPGSPDEEGDDDLPVCQLYRRGSCPHGITGLRKVNGRTCNLGHPKRCQKYCQYADDPEEGCTNGRDCDFFHPILCKFGLKYKLCTNRSCKFTHIKGTRRYRPRADQQDNQHPDHPSREDNYRPRNPFFGAGAEKKAQTNQVWDNQQTTQNHRPNQVWESHLSHSQNHQSNPQLNHQNNLQLDFLEEIKSQMREMQKEIREMKESYKPVQIPFLPNPVYNPQTINPHLPHIVANLQKPQANIPLTQQQIHSTPLPPRNPPMNPQAPEYNQSITQGSPLQTLEVSQKSQTSPMNQPNQLFQSQM